MVRSMSPPPAATSVPSKGDLTRQRLTHEAALIARAQGLEGLSIGSVAEAAGMSKSGVFAHFGSREDLQIAVLDAAAEFFAETVFRPALRERRGLPRIEALVERWFDFVAAQPSGGCILTAAASEFDDRPGPVRERVRAKLLQLRGDLERAVQLAIEAGDFRRELDAGQFAFELHALLLVVHHDARLLDPETARARGRSAFRGLVERARRTPFPSA